MEKTIGKITAVVMIVNWKSASSSNLRHRYVEMTASAATIRDLGLMTKSAFSITSAWNISCSWN
jgi:hypothetical protein